MPTSSASKPTPGQVAYAAYGTAEGQVSDGFWRQDAVIKLAVYCLECQARWTNVYTLTGYEALLVPPPLTILERDEAMGEVTEETP